MIIMMMVVLRVGPQAAACGSRPAAAGRRVSGAQARAGWAALRPNARRTSGILTTWHEYVQTCLYHVCTVYVQWYSSLQILHIIVTKLQILKIINMPVYRDIHVYIFLQMYIHVYTWYVHGMYMLRYKRVCTLFRRVCTSCLY